MNDYKFRIIVTSLMQLVGIGLLDSGIAHYITLPAEPQTLTIRLTILVILIYLLGSEINE